MNGKIALGKCDRFLRGIAVLGYQVAGITGKHEVFYFSLSALAVGNQFRDGTKMIVAIEFRCFTRFYGPLDGGEEIFPSSNWF